MHVTLPTLKLQDASCNKMISYLEWETKSLKKGPLLTAAQYATLGCCLAAFAATDCLCQTALLVGKIVTLNLNRAELKDHAQKAALYALHATASSVSLAAALVFVAAFVIQFTIAVPLAARVATLGFLIVSANAFVWVHDPDRQVAHFQKYQLVYTKTRWDKIKEYINEKKESLIANRPRYLRTAKKAAAISAGSAAVTGAAWWYFR